MDCILDTGICLCKGSNQALKAAGALSKLEMMLVTQENGKCGEMIH